MSDYERGVEQASAIYKEAIREYVAENAKLREAARDLYYNLRNRETVMELMGLPLSSVQAAKTAAFARQLRELGIEVSE